MSIEPLVSDKMPRLPAGYDPGAAPMLQWIEIGDLVIDRRYQREVTAQGRRTVARIAGAFSWSKFAPVIVSPLEGGRYAVVDGQHRATAAAMVGIERVPCAVILLDLAGQAAAFRAINGTVTKVRVNAIYRAALVAGDPAALAIQDVCERAEVKIISSNRVAKDMKRGETAAVGAISSALEVHGRDVVVTALQCITQTGEGNPGCINRQTIRALCQMFARRSGWLELGGSLLDACDDIDFADLLEQSVRDGGAKGAVERLSLILENKLAAMLPDAVAA